MIRYHEYFASFFRSHLICYYSFHHSSGILLTGGFFQEKGSTPLRIVHFSDIHAAGWIRGFRGYFDKRLLGTLNFLIRRKYFHNWNLVHLAVARIKQLAPDVVVCTGDLATISGKNEFELAKKALGPLVEDCSFEFMYVPGNHDYYIDTLECKNLLENIFYYMNRGRLNLSDLPTSFKVQNLRFFLVNQAKPSPLFLSSGDLDKKTQDWFKAHLATVNTPDYKTVLVGHYPLFDKNGNNLPRRRRCSNNSVLQTALRDGTIDISLCGHIHEGFVRWGEKASVEICAGSLTKTGKLNVIDCLSGDDEINQQWVDVVSAD